MAISVEPYSFPCDLCEMIFKTECKLDEHTADEHSNKEGNNEKSESETPASATIDNDSATPDIQVKATEINDKSKVEKG